MSLIRDIDSSRLPCHIAIVMDGNGRWAKKHSLPRLLGHRRGVKTVQRIVAECSRLNVEVLTLYAFSTENWGRPSAEVKGLMSLLSTYLRKELPQMMKNNIRLRTIGDGSRLPETARRSLVRTIEETAGNTGMTLNLALNYGGRDEIVRAVNRMLKDGVARVTEETVNSYLDTAGLPDPDLFIRTSGEMRTSNFMPWQMAYTELCVTPVLWPDFKEEDLHRAIIEFQKRERRFGKV